MPRPWPTSGGNQPRIYKDRHRFEHWYRDNQIYFITVKTRDGAHAFQSEDSRAIFWDRFDYHTAANGFVPIVTSLLSNHYHTLGYLKSGNQLPKMMNGINGSVAKLVNDTLDERLKPFWHQDKNHTYFDGCIRDEKQFCLTYRYVLTQCSRHRICDDWRDYSDTVVGVEMERALKRAVELKAFLYGVPYKRYLKD